MVLRAVGCLVHGLEYISAAAREALEFTLQTAALRRCTGTTRALYPVFGFRSTVSEVHSPPTIFLDFATVRLANSGTGARISATTRCAAIMMHMHHDVRSGSLPFRATSVPCVTAPQRHRRFEFRCMALPHAGPERNGTTVLNSFGEICRPISARQVVPQWNGGICRPISTRQVVPKWNGGFRRTSSTRQVFPKWNGGICRPISTRQVVPVLNGGSQRSPRIHPGGPDCSIAPGVRLRTAGVFFLHARRQQCMYWWIKCLDEGLPMPPAVSVREGNFVVVQGARRWMPRWWHRRRGGRAECCRRPVVGRCKR